MNKETSKKDDGKKDDAKSDARPYKPTAFESCRETIDSIAIAFILAFLFRTFEAEAFVIPTGSMALTLMGAHKDLQCPECGIPYCSGASGETPEDPTDRPLFVTTSICPNCRFQAHFENPPPPTYNGDRILVTKYTYEFHDPERYDVAVFKNPKQASQNYIKRIVGLPNEEVLVYRGDVYSKAAGDDKFKIRRKPPEKIVSTAQRVYDNDYVLKKIVDRGWPQRWQPHADPGDSAWKVSDDLKSFTVNGKFPNETWLRYRHIVPTRRNWATLARGRIDPKDAVPQLITDFCEYNANDGNLNNILDLNSLGLHWVSDLILECELEFRERQDDRAEAVLELVEGGRALQCRIQVATGDVELAIQGVESFHPKAKAAVVGAGPHRLRFANVDDHLTVWVNDRPLTFDVSTNYIAVNAADVMDAPQHLDPQPDRVALDGETQLPVLDLSIPKRQDEESPVGIAARGVAVQASHLRVLRDVYYIASNNFTRITYVIEPRMDSTMSDYYDDVFRPYRQQLRPGEELAPDDSLRLFMSNVESDPKRWQKLRGVTFPLGADQFFVLGDNSPHSLDGRLWNAQEYFVKRELLIGKALFVYWPHGHDYIPGTSVKFPGWPYWPNVGSMRLIR